MENKEKAINWFDSLDYETKFDYYIKYVINYISKGNHILDSELYDIWYEQNKVEINNLKYYDMWCENIKNKIRTCEINLIS